VCDIGCDREKKDLKAKQAKHSMESVKSVMSDKTVKNKAERDRYTGVVVIPTQLALSTRKHSLEVAPATLVQSLKSLTF